MAYAGFVETGRHIAVLDAFLPQLAAISGRCMVPADRLCSAVAPGIRHIPTFSGEIELDDAFRVAVQLAPVAFLEFTADVDVNEDAAFENFHPFGDRSKVLRAIAERRLAEAIATVGLAIYLAMPGELHLSAPEFQSETSRELRREWGELHIPSRSGEANAWPPLVRIPLVNVVDWLDAVPGWNRGISDGPVARAVAALSQALAADRESGGGSAMPLVWCMVGLEALYCRDPEGLRSQLIRHSQLLLGRMERDKKRFGKVYDYRSSFLHGGLDIPFAHREVHSPDDAVWQFIWDSDAEAGLAFATLIATIQQLILRGAHSLDFVTVVRTASIPASPS